MSNGMFEKKFNNFIDAVIEMPFVLALICVLGIILAAAIFFVSLAVIFIISVAVYPQIFILLMVSAIAFAIYTFITAKGD